MKKWNHIRIAIWFLFGVVFSYSITAMFLSGTWNFDQFYDNGSIFKVFQPNVYMENTVLVFEDETYVHVLGDSCRKEIEITSKKKSNWNYIYMYLDNVFPEELNFKIDYYHGDKFLTTQNVQVSQGANIVETDNNAFTRIDIVIENQVNALFWLEKVEFREKIYKDVKKDFVIVLPIVFVFYIILSFFVISFFVSRKISFHRYIVFFCCMIQKIWIRVFQPIGDNMELVNDKYKSRGRIFCIVLVLLYSLITTKYGRYLDRDVYYWYILSQLIILLVLACFNMREGMKLYTDVSLLQKIWILLCIGMCISDLIVKKKFMFTGYWLIGIFGLMFWSYCHNQKREMMLKEFAVSYEIIFLISCVFCFLFEPYHLGELGDGYVGMTKNPNTLGEFMTIAIGVLFVLVDEMFYDDKNKKKIIWKAMEILLCVFFIRKSNCRASNIFLILIVAIFVWKNLWNFKNKLYVRNCVVFFMTLILLYIPANSLFEWNLRELSGVFGISDNMFHDDDKEVLCDLNGMIVYAKDKAGDYDFEDLNHVRFMERLDLKTSDRVSIYRQYINKFNLWGHFGDEEVMGNRIGAHNLFITLTYRYGVVVGFLYFIFVIGTLGAGVTYLQKNKNEKDKYALMPIAVALAFVVSAFWGNIEQPLRYGPWIAYYFTIGIYLG